MAYTIKNNLMQPKVSVIITVFNCEKYIETCACSLFEQTLDNIEYVFVNDASTDNSITILNRIIRNYPTLERHTIIINIKRNRGVSNARQIGIGKATGEYIIHCDSDDWIDKNMYEQLYKKAKETDADIVGCNFRHEFPDMQYEFHQQYDNNLEENRFSSKRNICCKPNAILHFYS